MCTFIQQKASNIKCQQDYNKYKCINILVYNSMKLKKD